MFSTFEQLGFSHVDISLIIWCPFFGIIGGFIHVFTTDIDYSKTPKASNFTPTKIDDKTRKEIIEHRGLWIASRLFIGGATGLFLALYFAGAITADATSVGRLFALAMIAGYAAPSFWKHHQSSKFEDLLKP